MGGVRSFVYLVMMKNNVSLGVFSSRKIAEGVVEPYECGLGDLRTVEHELDVVSVPDEVIPSPLETLRAVYRERQRLKKEVEAWMASEAAGLRFVTNETAPAWTSYREAVLAADRTFALLLGDGT